MTYCTKQDMIDRFSEQELIDVTDREQLMLINDVVLDQAISDAAAEIDSYLGRYDLPLSVVPPVLVRLSCDIARYFLYDDMPTEQVTKRYEVAIKFLLNVAKGHIDLAQPGAPSATQNLVLMQSDGSVFARSGKGLI